MDAIAPTGTGQVHQRLRARKNLCEDLLRAGLLFLNVMSLRAVSLENCSGPRCYWRPSSVPASWERNLSGGNVARCLARQYAGYRCDAGNAHILLSGRFPARISILAVTLADASQGGMRLARCSGLISSAQAMGAMLGVGRAHLMFGGSRATISQTLDAGGSALFSEFVATFGLLCVIWGCRSTAIQAVPFAVGYTSLVPTGSQRPRHSQIRP